MGERAFEQEATPDDLALMAGQLSDALSAGAIGFSTSRVEHHQTSDDRPVASRLASWEEVVALVGVMGALGRGIFEGVDGGMLASDPEVRAGTLDRFKVLAADHRRAPHLRSGCHPGSGPPARLPRRRGRGRRSRHSPDALPGHFGVALTQDTASRST